MNTSVPLPNVNPRMGRTAYLRAASALSDPPVGTIGDITDYVTLFKSKRDKQICLNKYYKAHDTKQMMESFSRRAQTSLYTRRCEYEINDYNEKLSDTKTNEIDFDDVSKTRLVEFEQNAENKLNALKARHQKELEQHELKKPKELPAKYRKRSPELINLYRTERKLSIDNNFEEAKMIRAEINKREAQESKAVMQRAINTWKIEGQHLIEKQRKELEAMTQRLQSQRIVENSEINSMKESIHKREKILNSEIGTVKHNMRSSAPFAMRRHLFYTTTPTAKTRALVPDMSKDVYALASTLPKRSREILAGL